MCYISTYAQNINYILILRPHSLYYMYASMQCETGMSCIHNNEKVLAKKAQFVRVQQYVKSSHYYAGLYIGIVIL